MTKYLYVFLATFVLSTAAIGQDYKKSEFFVGYSNGQVDESNFRYFQSNSFGDTGPGNFHGFNVSGVYNFSKYVGLKGDFSATFDRGDTRRTGTGGTITGDRRNSLYNILGGVQVKNNDSEERFKPFGHVMVGAGIAKADASFNCSGSGCPGGVVVPDDRATGFATVIGGGFDVKVNDRFDVRVIQMDYNPIRFSNAIDHNVRIGFGIVIK